MSNESSESGFDELMRLSRQTSKMAQDIDQIEHEKKQSAAEKRQIMQGLREIKFSVALGQLKVVATPEIVKEVDSMKNKQGTGDLRKLILDLANELEKGVNASSPDVKSFGRTVKTMVILIELLFSLE